MKIEPELIKHILEWGEDHLPDRTKAWSTNEIIISGFTTDQITFHVYLLWKKEYINCSDVSADNKPEYFYNYITLNGYQYLNLLRSKAWNTAKSIIQDLGVIFVEAAIKAVIDKYN